MRAPVHDILLNNTSLLHFLTQVLEDLGAIEVFLLDTVCYSGVHKWSVEVTKCFESPNGQRSCK